MGGTGLSGGDPTRIAYRRWLLALAFASASAPSEPMKRTASNSIGTLTGVPSGPMPIAVFGSGGGLPANGGGITATVTLS